MERKVFSYKGKVVFERVNLPQPFKRFPKLFQENEACFMYLDKGGFAFRTPTSLFEVYEGQAIVAKCGNYYIEQIPSAASSHDTLSVIGAYFYPEMVKDFFQTDLQLVDFRNNFDVQPSIVEPLMKSFIEGMNYLIDHPELVDDNLLINKLKELLLLLGKTEHSIQDYVNALFTPFEYDFKEIILENTYTNLSLAELAHLCGCSLATFKRRFDKYFEQSPAKYFLQKKLEKAIQLLSIPTLPIADIAYDCGFENVTHFNKAFKKQVGQTPSQVRMSQKDKKLSF